MKKRLIATILCALLMASLLLGCGGEPATSSSKEDNPAVTTTTTTAPLEGTGGGGDGCPNHQYFYHSIGGDWEKVIEKEKLDAFKEKYFGKGEECNIVTFVEFCGITREQYIEVMGMADVLDEKLTRHHPDCPYTNREFVEAIFGDDPELSERVFAADVFESKEKAE